MTLSVLRSILILIALLFRQHNRVSTTQSLVGCGLGWIMIMLTIGNIMVRAQDVPGAATANVEEQKWNWHVQNTDIVQGDPGFHAKYSGPNSLNNHGEVQETVSLDLYAGIRLWRGAEAHVDGLMWQGFGLSQTVGVEGFPNGEAFKFGTQVPNFTFARLFIRQTIGFGGQWEDVPDGELTLAGKQDVSRLTLTIGRFSAKDIFDNNAYANDPRTQFMNWALMANATWDYPADTVGFTTGLALELNQPK
jgi:high affinity Mn2+ porin